MITKFLGKKISAMLGILPETIGHFDDEVGNYSFPAQQTMRLKKVMGYNQHRLSKETSTVSDFGVFGLNYILQNGWIKKDEIGAVFCEVLEDAGVFKTTEEGREAFDRFIATL